MLIFSKHIFLSGYHALAIWPFIILKNKGLKRDPVLINHERIHLRQQLELLWLPYFVWYLLEFLFNWLRYREFPRAYYEIGFEKEAYAHEHDFEYLENRRFWNFRNYYRWLH